MTLRVTAITLWLRPDSAAEFVRGVIVALLVASFSIPAKAQALRVELVSAVNGEPQSVLISNRAPTLLMVKNGRLKSVRAESDKVRIQADRTRGDALLVLQPGVTGAVTIFVATERVTFPLTLVPREGDAATIVVHEMGADAMPVGARAPAQREPARASSAPYVREIKSLILAAASARPGPEFAVEHVNRPVRLWAEADILHRRSVSGRGYRADHWSLQNVSATPLGLDEQEFYGRDVLAVAIERHRLAPGETTQVYIVRSVEAQP